MPGAVQSRSGVARRIGASPLEVPRRLIRMFSITGETVLDPFLGRGTPCGPRIYWDGIVWDMRWTWSCEGSWSVSWMAGVEFLFRGEDP